MTELPDTDAASGLTPEEKERLQRRFRAEFGISTDDAIQRIKAGAGMPSPAVPWSHRVPSALADDSGFLRLVWLRWGWRAYIAMFAGIGCLALSKLGPMHWVGLAAAVIAVGAAVWCSVLMQVYRRRWKHAAPPT